MIRYAIRSFGIVFTFAYLRFFFHLAIIFSFNRYIGSSRFEENLRSRVFGIEKKKNTDKKFHKGFFFSQFLLR